MRYTKGEKIAISISLIPLLDCSAFFPGPAHLRREPTENQTRSVLVWLVVHLWFYCIKKILLLYGTIIKSI